jgi:hypothetical protein
LATAASRGRYAPSPEYFMTSNLEKLKKDLDTLINLGDQLHNAIQVECLPEQVYEQLAEKYTSEETKKLLEDLPQFSDTYQVWYSEAKVMIKQLLPDRLEDFTRLFEKPRVRKEISVENYKIEDYLQGLTITRGFDKTKIVGPDSAISLFRQQLSIVKAIKKRFVSSLFDIKQILQADLFDSEIDTAYELNKNKFHRAAGVVAGVVLEKHLRQICENHSLKLTKKTPTISDFNDLLKENGVIETPQWRFIQHLGDIRNLCGHDKKIEPTSDQVQDLISGVEKITKTLF